MTERQQKFLDVLFYEAKGNIRKAMDIAGYSENTSQKEVLDSVKDQLLEKVKSELATKGAIHAVYGLFEVFEEPEAVGKKEKISAAKEILDRIGVTKVDKVEVTATNPLFILPNKNEDN